MASAPTQNVLHEAALAYLTHRPASVAQLRRVLGRRIDAWSRRAAKSGADEEAVAQSAATAREAGEAVLTRLLASGLLNDATFAKNRAERLTRAGKSRRAVSFDLRQKGVPEDAARAAIPQDAETELGAAVALMRKKRLGPFAKSDEADEKTRTRWLSALARAGYSFNTANRALKMGRDEAEDLLRSRA